MIDPLDGTTLMPGAEADHEVDPVMAEPPLVMVNSTCPVLALQAPLTVMEDLSQTEAGVLVVVAVAVAVGVNVGVNVDVATLAAPACPPRKLVGVGVGVCVCV